MWAENKPGRCFFKPVSVTGAKNVLLGSVGGTWSNLQLTFSYITRVKGLISPTFGSTSLLIYLDLHYYIPEVKTVKFG